MTGGPLRGLSVLAAEQMHSLPHATQLLALMGAEVIKVEPLGGEAGRRGHPAIVDRAGAGVGSTFMRNNLGKASVAIDLKTDAGRTLFLQLATTVDAVAENFRPGTADKLGIGFDAVEAVNPRAVYLSISGFGHETNPPSPYRHRAAYAPIVEGMAGLYEYSREPDEAPRPSLAGALGDTAPGLYAVIGLLAALAERERSGRGCHVDVPMYDAMIAVADVVHPSSVGVEPNRALEGIGILHAFRADDGFFTVEVVREHHFAPFAMAVGHPEWTTDQRLRTRRSWSEQMESIIRPGVEGWAATKTKAEAASELAKAGVAAGPVNTAADIVSDPHVLGRHLIHRPAVSDPSTTVAVVGNPISFHGRPQEPSGADDPTWPVLGGDTDRVLAGRLGLNQAELERLRSEGIIG